MLIIERTRDAHLDMLFTKPDDYCRCTVENKVSIQGIYCSSAQIRIPMFSRKNARLYALQYMHCLIDICLIYSFFLYDFAFFLFYFLFFLFGGWGIAFCCICIKSYIFVSSMIRLVS